MLIDVASDNPYRVDFEVWTEGVNQSTGCSTRNRPTTVLECTQRASLQNGAVTGAPLILNFDTLPCTERRRSTELQICVHTDTRKEYVYPLHSSKCVCDDGAMEGGEERQETQDTSNCQTEASHCCEGASPEVHDTLHRKTPGRTHRQESWKCRINLDSDCGRSITTRMRKLPPK